jgi:hypothetical protein
MVAEDPSLLPSRGVVMVRGYWIVLGAKGSKNGSKFAALMEVKVEVIKGQYHKADSIHNYRPAQSA